MGCTDSSLLNNNYRNIVMCKPGLFQKSFRDTEEGQRMLSTDGEPCLHDINDTHSKYTKREIDANKLYENVVQLISVAGIFCLAQIPEVKERLKIFAEIKENSKELRLTTERPETMSDKAMPSDMEHQEFTAVHYGTALNNIDTVSKIQNESSLQNTEESYDDLLRLRIFPQPKLQICPFSLSNYFESITNGTPVSQDVSMSNTCLRLSSYSSFPLDINISLIKMAKTGFYYIDGWKTKCFSCGITYDKWKSGDDPVVIHRMLSPSCVLVAEPSSSNQEARTIVGSINTDSTVDTRTITIQDTENLMKENKHLKDQRLCKVCLDLEASFAFLPCGHIVCCIDCAPAMRKCPVCRTYVKKSVKTYLE